MMILRSADASPFGRKARMAIDVLGLSDRVTIVPGDPLDEKDTLRLENPLGKMPCLLTADGTAIYDSGVIIEFLGGVAAAQAQRASALSGQPVSARPSAPEAVCQQMSVVGAACKAEECRAMFQQAAKSLACGG